MKDKKLQIFVSSTFTDLKEERQAAVEAILSSGHIPAGMELFSAGDETQMTVIERWINESDVYLLILGGRYGSIESKSGKSYTHLEYEYAISLAKPLFAVVISDEALEKKVKDIGTSVIETDNTKELKKFRAEVTSNLVKFFDDKKDIKLAIHETLSELNYRKDLVGWIRGDNAINTGVLAEEIARLTKENHDLREQVNTGSIQNISSLYANMTYEELAELLSRNIVEQDMEQMNLLDFLLKFGARFTSGTGNINMEAFNKLVLYKIIARESASGIGIRYYFTEDGHNFYLKAILKNNR